MRYGDALSPPYQNRLRGLRLRSFPWQHLHRRAFGAKVRGRGKAHFSVSTAESLGYGDEFFDVIVGVDILHHVNIGQALTECSRVLKRGGLAIFHEPVRAPVFDTLRETRFGRCLVPKEASLNRHVTQDERKLSADDFQVIRSFDPDLSSERLLLLSRLDRFFRNPNSKKQSRLEKIDFHLFRLLPFLKTYAGITVLVLKKQ